nr:MAG TPA: hypothetical protein [Caudoviricetes sp.]
MKGCCDSSTLSVGVESLPIVYSTGQMICTIFTLARHTTLRVNRE